MNVAESHETPDMTDVVNAVQTNWVTFARTGRPTARPADWPRVTHNTANRFWNTARMDLFCTQVYREERFKLVDSLPSIFSH